MVDETAKQPQFSMSAWCPVCEAPLHRGATRCWLCGAIEGFRAESQFVGNEATVSTPSEASQSEVIKPVALAVSQSEASKVEILAPISSERRPPIERVGSFSLASLMMFTTLLCVIFGVSSLWPGVGIPLGVVLLLVWIRTSAIVGQRWEHGLDVSRAEKLQLSLSSLGVATTLIALTFVVGFAAIDSVALTCWENGPRVVASLVILAIAAVSIPMMWVLWLIVMPRRWRRDIGEMEKTGRTSFARFFYRFLIFACIAALVLYILLLVSD